MASIPEEIIIEILRRLPVKSLLRFRSVSKPWRFLIDRKQFARRHLHHSLISDSNRTIIVDSTQLYYIDLDSFTQLQVGGTPIQPQSVICACDGLVLLTPSSGDVALWNPSMRKLRNLPEQPPIPDRFIRFEYVQAIFALGYDSKHDDYKVVRVVQAAADGDADTFLTEASIYSLNDDSWKRARNFPYLLPIHTSRWGIHLNGALHTVAKNGRVIMAFDLGKEEHSELPMPEYRRAGACLNGVSVEVLGGRLAAVVPGKKGMTEIWLMKEYGVRQSWMRLLRFQPPVSAPCRDLRPLAFSKSGDEVLLSYDGMCLNWYHLKKKTITIAYVDGVSASFGAAPSDPYFDAEFCVGSLVSPYSPNGKEVQKRNFTRKEINKKRDEFLSSGFKLRL